MSHYRRWYVPGGTYFFTVVTYRRYPYFQSDAARQLLGAVMREVQAESPFQVVATVLLPDHLHAVWTLPAGDSDYSTRWKRIKARFTDRWLASGGHEERVTLAQERRGNRGIWQKRFRENTIDDQDYLTRVCDYIHYNPVKHGYVLAPRDWPQSTFLRFVAEGEYELDWGRSEPASIAGLDLE